MAVNVVVLSACWVRTYDKKFCVHLYSASQASMGTIFGTHQKHPVRRIAGAPVVYNLGVSNAAIT